MTLHGAAPPFLQEGDGTANASLNCDTVDPKSQCSSHTLPHRRKQT